MQGLVFVTLGSTGLQCPAKLLRVSLGSRMTESLTFFRATNSFSAVALSATSSSYLGTEDTRHRFEEGEKENKGPDGHTPGPHTLEGIMTVPCAPTFSWLMWVNEGPYAFQRPPLCFWTAAL